MGALLDIAIEAAASVKAKADGVPVPEVEAELRRLVPLVTSHLDYFKTDQDHAEALENALKYPDLTLPFWRGKAKQLGLK